MPASSLLRYLIRFACLLVLVLGPYARVPDLQGPGRHQSVLTAAEAAHLPLVQSRALPVVAKVAAEPDADGSGPPLLPAPLSVRQVTAQRPTSESIPEARSAGATCKGFWACAPPHQA